MGSKHPPIWSALSTVDTQYFCSCKSMTSQKQEFTRSKKGDAVLQRPMHVMHENAGAENIVPQCLFQKGAQRALPGSASALSQLPLCPKLHRCTAQDLTL